MIQIASQRILRIVDFVLLILLAFSGVLLVWLGLNPNFFNAGSQDFGASTALTIGIFVISTAFMLIAQKIASEEIKKIISEEIRNAINDYFRNKKTETEKASKPTDEKKVQSFMSKNNGDMWAKISVKKFFFGLRDISLAAVITALVWIVFFLIFFGTVLSKPDEFVARISYIFIGIITIAIAMFGYGSIKETRPKLRLKINNNAKKFLYSALIYVVAAISFFVYSVVFNLLITKNMQEILAKENILSIILRGAIPPDQIISVAITYFVAIVSILLFYFAVEPLVKAFLSSVRVLLKDMNEE